VVGSGRSERKKRFLERLPDSEQYLMKHYGVSGKGQNQHQLKEKQVSEVNC
jgi:hypothetical protein